MKKAKEERYRGIREVPAWSEPTHVLVLTDSRGTRRLRVEMLASDVTAESLDTLTALLEQVEEDNPITPPTSDDSPILRLITHG